MAQIFRQSGTTFFRVFLVGMRWCLDCHEAPERHLRPKDEIYNMHWSPPPGPILFTIHGTLMVWFFLIPSIPAVLGNFVIPMMIGARDVAFPKLNLLSWDLFNAGGLLALYATTFGGVDTGWTFYTPYSSTYSNSHVITMAAGIFIADSVPFSPASISSSPPIRCGRRA
jgi:Cytochrome C and Quinol oxidase polypeptide I